MATNSEVCAPRMTRSITERPSSSVPNQCWLSGGAKNLFKSTWLAPSPIKKPANAIISQSATIR